MKMETRILVTRLQSLGVRVPPDVLGRDSGAGPAEGRAFLIDGRPVNIPILAEYARSSPFEVEKDSSGCLLKYKGSLLRRIELVPLPKFYDRTYKNKIPYKKIALLHGDSCLATTVFQHCVHWKRNISCAFCGINLSYEKGLTILKKEPDQLAQVAEAAQRDDSVRHVVLTSGTMPDRSEIFHLAECARAVKLRTGLKIHVQFIPLDDDRQMLLLKESGVDTVGIHIESFDKEVLHRIAPAKAAIGVKRYERSWSEAVKIFGPNQVSSFIIAGLGEKESELKKGIETLADMGVFPFLVPLRPIPGSIMEKALPPDPEYMIRLYESTGAVLAKKGLASSSSLAGCVRCGACSALSFYERKTWPISYHRARTQNELDAAFAVRRKVFVQEQGLFAESDRDENDEVSMHIVAVKDREIIGTVRIYPGKEPGSWIGGRLAVLKGYRVGRVGATLVREAVKRAKKAGCRRFTAYIQTANINFFKRLGWKPVGEPFLYMNLAHQLMEADLKNVEEEI